MNTLCGTWCHQKKDLKIFFYPSMPACTSLHLFTPAPGSILFLTLDRSSRYPSPHPSCLKFTHAPRENIVGKEKKIPYPARFPAQRSNPGVVDPSRLETAILPPLPATLLATLLRLSTRTLLLVAVVLRV